MMFGLVKVHCTVEEGLIPSEKIVRVQSADGYVEEVSVSSKIVEGDRLVVSAIGEDKGMVLLELPRESAAGRWRMWVNKAAVEHK